MRILVIDDEKDTLTLLRGLLGRRGHHVTTAATAGEAMVYVQMARFDLVLLDIMMPGIDGHEFAKWITSHWDTSDIPIVVISGRKDPETKSRARMNGCLAYLEKPFSLEELLEVIGQIEGGQIQPCVLPS